MRNLFIGFLLGLSISVFAIQSGDVLKEWKVVDKLWNPICWNPQIWIGEKSIHCPTLRCNK